LTSGYDAIGQRTMLSDNLASAGLATFTYDGAYRLTSITRSVGGVAGPEIDYGYDSGGRLTSLSRSIGCHRAL
jgi:YD repeat-containing protein